jgi:UrcA family protein
MSSNRSYRLLAAAGALALGSAFAAEQSTLPEITVEAARPTTTVVGRSSIGAPIERIQLRHLVGYADLDLSTKSGAAALERRVNEAAATACKELDQLYPLKPSDPSCATKAADGAMSQVHTAIAAAEKRGKSADK